MKIWDTRSGAAVTKLTGHADVILAMDTIFGKELSYILTASDDGIVKRFDVRRCDEGVFARSINMCFVVYSVKP